MRLNGVYFFVLFFVAILRVRFFVLPGTRVVAYSSACSGKKNVVAFVTHIRSSCINRQTWAIIANAYICVDPRVRCIWIWFVSVIFISKQYYDLDRYVCFLYVYVAGLEESTKLKYNYLVLPFSLLGWVSSIWPISCWLFIFYAKIWMYKSSRVRRTLFFNRFLGRERNEHEI